MLAVSLCFFRKKYLALLIGIVVVIWCCCLLIVVVVACWLVLVELSNVVVCVRLVLFSLLLSLLSLMLVSIACRLFFRFSMLFVEACFCCCWLLPFDVVCRCCLLFVVVVV